MSILYHSFKEAKRRTAQLRLAAEPCVLALRPIESWLTVIQADLKESGFNDVLHASPINFSKAHSSWGEWLEDTARIRVEMRGNQSVSSFKIEAQGRSGSVDLLTDEVSMGYHRVLIGICERAATTLPEDQAKAVLQAAVMIESTEFVRGGLGQLVYPGQEALLPQDAGYIVRTLRALGIK